MIPNHLSARIPLEKKRRKTNYGFPGASLLPDGYSEMVLRPPIPSGSFMTTNNKYMKESIKKKWGTTVYTKKRGKLNFNPLSVEVFGFI